MENLNLAYGLDNELKAKQLIHKSSVDILVAI